MIIDPNIINMDTACGVVIIELACYSWLETVVVQL